MATVPGGGEFRPATASPGGSTAPGAPPPNPTNPGRDNRPRHQPKERTHVGKLITAIVCLALVGLCIYGMWHGWRSRLARQSNMFGSLKEVPERYEGLTADAAFEGEYISTTIFGNWLDRVGFDSLGFKSKSTLLIYPDSIIFTRDGAKDLWIPAKKLSVITTDRGMAGKVVEKDGLIVIGWTLDVHRVQTGFRTLYAEDKQAALEELRRIAPNAVDAPEKWAADPAEGTEQAK